MFHVKHKKSLNGNYQKLSITTAKIKKDERLTEGNKQQSMGIFDSQE